MNATNKTPGFSVPTNAIGELEKGEKLHEVAYYQSINITLDQKPELTDKGQWVFTATGPHGKIDYLIDPAYAHYGPDLYYGHVGVDTTAPYVRM